MISTKTMTFWEHLFELRKRFLYVVLMIVIFSILGYYCFPFLIDYLYPVLREDLYINTITEGFMTRLEVAFLIGVFFSLPFLLCQIVVFIAPALRKRQKVALFFVLLVSFLLFTIGIFFALYTVLPMSVQFLKSPEFNPDNVTRILSFSSFLKFFFQFLIGFGLFFEFPVVLIILMKMKVTSPRKLLRDTKILIPGIFLISAILTPPDVISQILLAAPMVVMYFLCILIGLVFRLG